MPQPLHAAISISFHARHSYWLWLSDDIYAIAQYMEHYYTTPASRDNCRHHATPIILKYHTHH
jgi:hypothetical protein